MEMRMGGCEKKVLVWLLVTLRAWEVGVASFDEMEDLLNTRCRCWAH